MNLPPYWFIRDLCGVIWRLFDRRMVNFFGLCDGYKSGLLHPDDDYEEFKRQASRSIFRCTQRVSGGYLIVENYEHRFRIKRRGFSRCPKIPFDFGMQVRVKSKPDHIAIIYNIYWHGKRREAMYFLIIDGKKKSRRYWADELEVIESAAPE